MFKKNISGVLRTLVLMLFLTTYHHLNAQISAFKGRSLFIYHFSKHIKWPNSSDVFTIGVIGNQELYSELSDGLKDKDINGTHFLVKPITSLRESDKCQIIYLSENKSLDLYSLISIIGNKDVLIITEHDLTDEGAGISFLQIENKVRFKINQSVLQRRGLQVSTGLLSLALK